MSGKRLADGVEGVPAAKKFRFIHKWIAENEKELLRMTPAFKNCTMFESKLIGMRNFSLY